MTADPQVRRATIEDLPQLRELWRQENLPWQTYEPIFKDFQVAQTESGQVIGGLGLQVAGNDGWIFAEAFLQPDQADYLRQKFWERARIVSQNHGLFRIWTQLSSPFWHLNGFTAATPEELTKKPTAFSGSEQPWCVIRLREETVGAVNLDREFALFQEAHKAERQNLYRQARIAKAIAIIVAVLLLGLMGMLTLRFIGAAHRSPPRSQPAK